jgi:hypothetical protein
MHLNALEGSSADRVFGRLGRQIRACRERGPASSERRGHCACVSSKSELSSLLSWSPRVSWSPRALSLCWLLRNSPSPGDPLRKDAKVTTDRVTAITRVKQKRESPVETPSWTVPSRVSADTRCHSTQSTSGHTARARHVLGTQTARNSQRRVDKAVIFVSILIAATAR